LALFDDLVAPPNRGHLMRRNLATTLAILSLPLGAGLAMAKGPVPQGTTATVNISLAVKEKDQIRLGQFRD
jgi:hypothetical protein